MELESDLFNTRITRGDSFTGGFATLQTLKSPFEDCVANMSDFCFDEDACQASERIGEGPREVVSVWRIVNWGRRFAIKIDPFWYLVQIISFTVTAMQFQSIQIPNRICPTICSWCKSCNWIEYRAGRYVLRSRRLEQNHFAFSISWAIISNANSSQCTSYGIPNATLPFRIHDATRKCSNEANLAISVPVKISHTIAVCPTS